MLRSIGVVLAAGALCLAAEAGAERVESVFDGGDPFALVDGDTVWIYPTGGKGLEGWSSTDLVHWQNHGPLLRKSDIKWIDDDGAPSHGLWAPDMLAANGRYYFYYSIGPQHPTPSRLGVATCEGSAGPCTDSGQPLLTGGNGFEAIDPMVFADAKSGKTYLYAGGSAGSTLRVFVLTPDLLRIDHEVDVDQPPHFTEGAFMHERDGIYYLSYSHGRYNDATYEVHYATAPTPTGPWTYRGVILKTDDTFKGPGHHSFFRDPRDGSWRIAYHRWEGKKGPGPYRGHRRVAIQKISYAADGAIEPISMSD
ncbi:MAG TPA: family 43 glycosylhydrolase [Sphingomonas sp.]|nr:family 43 glycosylhydrolase [Sphingomonas sp.]